VFASQMLAVIADRRVVIENDYVILARHYISLSLGMSGSTYASCTSATLRYQPTRYYECRDRLAEVANSDASHSEATHGQ
jgi:hypothetical protein